MDHWEKVTCLHFPERNNHTDYVMFVFEGGCSSRVGRVGNGMQKINIGSTKSRCKKGNIVHEIGHALGFFHEQSRPDRDKYVEVLRKNVIGWYLNNFHKFNGNFLNDRGVPYDYGSIMHYGREESKENVKSAIEEWKKKTCVKLRPKTDSDTDYIEFVYDGGCSSYVGKIGGKQTISVGSDDGSITCKHGNVVHELAHSLGFFHEHSRPDRDEHIKVVYDNVMDGYERNFRKESFKTIDSKGVDYDYDSVMHYGAFFFTSNEGEKTIVTTTDGAAIGQRVGLSDLDIKQARLLYNCDDEIGIENAEAAVKHWQEKTCLEFKHRTSENDYINFVFEGGCASRVGRGGGMQKLTIGSTELRCKKGNIIHEMGHALGFFHEHSRPDRDEFVKIHPKNIMLGFERNFYKFSTKFIDSLNVPYDYGSIMHYGKGFFSKLAILQLPTMTITKELDEGQDIEIGQRIALSDMDILQANLLYKCDGRKRLSDDERDQYEGDYADPTVLNLDNPSFTKKVSSTMDLFSRKCLDAHNNYRGKHNVPALTWSNELAREAQVWAKNIAKKNKLMHAKDRKSGEGENIFMSSGADFDESGVNATDSWYSEVKNYDFKKGGHQPSTGHFTQVVWKSSAELGMARSKAKNGSVFVVARYKPGGNMMREYDANVLPTVSSGQPSSDTNNKINIAKEKNTYDNESKPADTVKEDQSISHFLQAHNQYRIMHGAVPLKWSPGLSKTAQAWAEKIAREGRLEHATREDRYYKGENICRMSSHFTFDDALRIWYSEKGNYDYNKPGFDLSTGHFTQIVWRGTREKHIPLSNSGGWNHSDMNGEETSTNLNHSKRNSAYRDYSEAMLNNQDWRIRSPDRWDPVYVGSKDSPKRGSDGSYRKSYGQQDSTRRSRSTDHQRESKKDDKDAGTRQHSANSYSGGCGQSKFTDHKWDSGRWFDEDAVQTSVNTTQHSSPESKILENSSSLKEKDKKEKTKGVSTRWQPEGNRDQVKEPKKDKLRIRKGGRGSKGYYRDSVDRNKSCNKVRASTEKWESIGNNGELEPDGGESKVGRSRTQQSIKRWEEQTFNQPNPSRQPFRSSMSSGSTIQPSQSKQVYAERWDPLWGDKPLDESRRRPVSWDSSKFGEDKVDNYHSRPYDEPRERKITTTILEGPKKTVVSSLTIILKGNDTTDGYHGCRDTKPRKTFPSLDHFSQQALDCHNVYRALHGASNLMWSPEIAKAAQHWAEKLARDRTLKNSTRERGVDGENLAMFTGNVDNASKEAIDMCLVQIRNLKEEEERRKERRRRRGGGRGEEAEEERWRGRGGAEEERRRGRGEEARKRRGDTEEGRDTEEETRRGRGETRGGRGDERRKWKRDAVEETRRRGRGDETRKRRRDAEEETRRGRGDETRKRRRETEVETRRGRGDETRKRRRDAEEETRRGERRRDAEEETRRGRGEETRRGRGDERRKRRREAEEETRRETRKRRRDAEEETRRGRGDETRKRRRDAEEETRRGRETRRRGDEKRRRDAEEETRRGRGDETLKRRGDPEEERRDAEEERRGEERRRGEETRRERRRRETGETRAGERDAEEERREERRGDGEERRRERRETGEERRRERERGDGRGEETGEERRRERRGDGRGEETGEERRRERRGDGRGEETGRGEERRERRGGDGRGEDGRRGDDGRGEERRGEERRRERRGDGRERRGRRGDGRGEERRGRTRGEERRRGERRGDGRGEESRKESKHSLILSCVVQWIIDDDIERVSSS
ncbi:hypothetical protein QZH41_004503 [Actinostola sp. cb2023]|nr:hypothetical protein QZH41_004503 [Actinostola sp. cb2023]